MLSPAPAQAHATPCARCNQARASSLHSWQIWAAATPGPEPAGAASSSFLPPRAGLTPGHHPRSEERWTSRETCSRGHCPHPQPRWAARSQGLFLHSPATAIASGVNHCPPDLHRAHHLHRAPTGAAGPTPRTGSLRDMSRDSISAGTSACGTGSRRGSHNSQFTRQQNPPGLWGTAVCLNPAQPLPKSRIGAHYGICSLHQVGSSPEIELCRGSWQEAAVCLVFLNEC